MAGEENMYAGAEGKRQLVRPRRRWRITLKYTLRKQSEGGGWIHLL
jgi:hypothetical protein